MLVIEIVSQAVATICANRFMRRNPTEGRCWASETCTARMDIPEMYETDTLLGYFVRDWRYQRDVGSAKLCGRIGTDEM